ASTSARSRSTKSSLKSGRLTPRHSPRCLGAPVGRDRFAHHRPRVERELPDHRDALRRGCVDRRRGGLLFTESSLPAGPGCSCAGSFVHASFYRATKRGAAPPARSSAAGSSPPACGGTSVPVVLRLERTLDRDAEVLRLVLRQLRQLDAELAEVERGDLLV